MIPTVGSMRERVTIQEEVRTEDGGGGWTVTWQNILTVSARVDSVSVSDNIRALALALSITHKVTMRWRSDLAALDTNRYRLQWGTIPMRIIGIINKDGKHRFLELTCESGQMVAT